jgi:glycosyltransferase involved in cell wall biosynthesis
MQKPKILIGLGEIAGYGANLRKGFRQLGVECDFISVMEHPFGYGGDDTNLLVRWVRWVRVKRENTPRSQTLRRALWFNLYALTRLLLLLWALPRYDVFIFLTNRTFLGHFDLPILKLLNKKIIFRFGGTDTRPPYLDGGIMAKSRGLSIAQCVRATKKQKKIVSVIDKYADVIVNYPPVAHFHERPFVASVLNPYHDDLNQEVDERDNPTGSVRILHAPSTPEPKGTVQIRQVIKALESKGYNIDFVEVSGKPHSVVLEEILRCDFVVDELYNDAPLGSLPAEAAFHGRPTVNGAYYAEHICRDLQPEWLPPGICRDLQPEWLPPGIFCHPDDLEQAIEKMIVDKDYRLELGRKAKTFVETYSSPRQVAKNYLQLIEGNFPQEWLYDPINIRYLLGASLSESRVRELVRAVIEEGGVEALQLDDKPELREMFVAFAFNQG